jgi:hypothetical protein
MHRPVALGNCFATTDPHSSPAQLMGFRWFELGFGLNSARKVPLLIWYQDALNFKILGLAFDVVKNIA